MTPIQLVRECTPPPTPFKQRAAKVVVGLVVAKKINPDPKYYTDDLWKRQNAIPFAFNDPLWWVD
jgi:hypothetical protein